MKIQTTPRIYFDVFVKKDKAKNIFNFISAIPKEIELLCPNPDCNFYADIKIKASVPRNQIIFDFVGMCRQCRQTLFLTGQCIDIKTFYGVEEGDDRTEFNFIREGVIKQVYPELIDKEIVIADEIPEKYKSDFLQAKQILKFSPKATAALCRRILQNLIRELLKARNIEDKPNLAQEIDAFIKLPDVPYHITKQVDAIRHIGNLAAHPTEHRVTGEILDVEPGEAEWMIIILELLFDEFFVRPAITDKQIESLKLKLEDATGEPINLKVPPEN